MFQTGIYGPVKDQLYVPKKAHAAAYVMMAYRIAYCKINYPLAYYGAYFGILRRCSFLMRSCVRKRKIELLYEGL